MGLMRVTVRRLRNVLPIALLSGAAGLAGCASTGGNDPVASASKNSGPVTVAPQESWDESIIYFVLVDRFADGDDSNNKNEKKLPSKINARHSSPPLRESRWNCWDRAILLVQNP